MMSLFDVIPGLVEAYVFRESLKKTPDGLEKLKPRSCSSGPDRGSTPVESCIHLPGPVW
jgi:hypothetical protein